MSTPPTTTPNRRGVLAGVGVVGAAAVAAAALPLARQAAPTAPAALGTDAAGGAPTEGAKDGYQVTAHVLRYYQTARV